MFPWYRAAIGKFESLSWLGILLLPLISSKVQQNPTSDPVAVQHNLVRIHATYSSSYSFLMLSRCYIEYSLTFFA
jgi:hypothetical protein